MHTDAGWKNRNRNTIIQEEFMSRTDELNAALSELQSGSADIEACAVVSEDGLIIASSLHRGLKRLVLPP